MILWRPLFYSKVIEKLRSDRIRGVLLLSDTNRTRRPRMQFSEDSECPNERFSKCSFMILLLVDLTDEYCFTVLGITVRVADMRSKHL